jgi:hypothetical protein
LVEIIDAGLDDVVYEIIDAGLDGSYHEHEAEDVVPAESTVPNAAAPLALPKDIERQHFKTELKKQVIVQFTWDPSGSEFLHRLGGKPKLKKRGMSGTTRGWAFIWAVGLCLVEHWPAGQLGIIYKKAWGQQRRGMNQIIRSITFLP